MVCLEFLYYTKQQLPQKIQVVPFTLDLLECYNISLPNTSQTSFFRYIWEPEVFNEAPNFFLKELSLQEVKLISNCLYDRMLTTNQKFYITCNSTEGENILNIQQSDMDLLQETYENISNDNLEISSLGFSIEWFFHVVSFWRFKFVNEITISIHSNLPRESLFSKIISYVSIYKQIYYISENKFVQELP